MRLRVLAGLLVSSTVAVLPHAAEAADLDGPYPPQAEAPYEDYRYREPYPEPPPTAYSEPRYGGYPGYPRGPIKDEGYIAPPPPPPPRYSDAPRFIEGPSCLSRHEVHERLIASGWGDFSDIEIRERVAYVKARRPSGRLFDLTVDRCTGGVVAARPVPYPAYRPYAGGPRYYDNRY